MKKHVFKFKFVLMGAVAIAAFSAITMLLWNWLMPCIFGLTTISFWQALGLLALVRILFSGIGDNHWMGDGHKRHHHNHLREKWMKMTHEEQKEFIKSRGFGHHPFGRDCERDFFNQKDEPEKKD
ncbi:MAG: hypothetical protein LBT24_05850 [Tannerella sp.]|jgi:hypothetical protein|nr:hypothetical protein [Tannerella sp.]